MQPARQALPSDIQESRAVMSGTPRQGSIQENIANSLTNKALANRLEILRSNPRRFSVAEKNSFLEEAARRLQWPDVYANHNREY
jgi:hypothetical protein